MNTKQKLRQLVQYLPSNDQSIALQCIDSSNWERLKEIVDSDVQIIEKLIQSDNLNTSVYDNVRNFQIAVIDFIEQYNIDIPCIDYEEIYDE